MGPVLLDAVSDLFVLMSLDSPREHASDVHSDEVGSVAPLLWRNDAGSDDQDDASFLKAGRFDWNGIQVVYNILTLLRRLPPPPI